MSQKLAMRGANDNGFADLSWLQTARGRLVRQCESHELESILPRLMGRTLLQVGDWSSTWMGKSSHWRTAVLGRGKDASVVCRSSALPLKADSVDAIVLAHGLEFADNPHTLLREVGYALSPKGQLVVMGFNPISLWGVRKFLGPWLAALPQGARLLSVWRLCDWLELLNFEIVEVRRFPTLSQKRWPTLNRWLSLFFPCYMIHAKKRTFPLTPMKQRRWRSSPKGLNIAQAPSARVAHDDGVVKS